MWLTLPMVSVQGANAMSGMFAVGYPAITAFSGMAKLVLRNIADLFQTPLTPLDGFAVVHHTGRARIYGRYNNKLTERRYLYDAFGAPGKPSHFMNPPSEFQPQADLRFSLIINSPLDDVIGSELRNHPHLVHRLIGPKALGGTVADCRPIRIAGDLSDGFANCPTGWVVVDQSAELAGQKDQDALDRMLDLLSYRPAPTEADEKPVTRRLFPAQIGFRAVSPLGRRPCQRDPEVDHVFAEPVIGLAEWRQRHDVLSNPDLLKKSCWHPSIDRESGLFLVHGGHHG